jgi:hypothetical protein
MKLGDDLDHADDVAIELWQLFRRNPQLLVLAAADDLAGVALDEGGVDLEARYEA